MRDAPVSLRVLPASGLLRVQGDPADTPIAAQLLQTAGLQLPAPCRYTAADPAADPAAAGSLLAWTAQAQWLLFCALPQEGRLLKALNAALAGHFVTVTPLSDSLIGFEVSGAAARDLLAKGCAIDTHDAAFGEGALAVTRFAGLTALLMRMPACWRLYVSAPYQGYLSAWLREAMAEWATADATAG